MRETQTWPQGILFMVRPHRTVGSTVDVQQSQNWEKDDMNVHSAELHGKAPQVLVPLTLAYGNYMS